MGGRRQAIVCEPSCSLRFLCSQILARFCSLLCLAVILARVTQLRTVLYLNCEVAEEIEQEAPSWAHVEPVRRASTRTETWPSSVERRLRCIGSRGAPTQHRLHPQRVRSGARGPSAHSGSNFLPALSRLRRCAVERTPPRGQARHSMAAARPLRVSSRHSCGVLAHGAEERSLQSRRCCDQGHVREGPRLCREEGVSDLSDQRFAVRVPVLGLAHAHGRQRRRR